MYIFSIFLYLIEKLITNKISKKIKLKIIKINKREISSIIK